MHQQTLRRAVILSAAVAGMSILPPATPTWAAASWDGGNGTLLWADANNWSPDAVPADTEDLLFDAGTAGVIDLGGNRVANSLSFGLGYTLGVAATANTLTNTSGNVTLNGGTTATINAVLAGTAGLNVTGNGTLQLNNAGNTFTGNILVDGPNAKLKVEGSNGTAADPLRLGPGAKTITLQNGATYISHTTATNPTSTNTKTWFIGTGGGTIQADTNVALDDAGQFGGTGNLTKTGAGDLLLAQSSTYSGSVVNVNAGFLTLRNKTALGAAAGKVINLNAGRLQLKDDGTGTQTFGYALNIPNAANVELDLNRNAGTATNTLLAMGTLSIGTATMNVIGANSYDASFGATTLTGNATFAVNDADGDDLTVGAIGETGGSWGFTKSGQRLMILNGNATNTGTTTVTGGALRTTSATSLSAGSNLTINGSVSAAIEGNTNFTRALGAGAGQVQLPGGQSGFSAFGAAISVNLGGAAAPIQWGSGSFNPSQLVLQSAFANNTLDFQNPLDLNGATRTVAGNGPNNGSQATISGAITNGTGTAGFTKAGGGIVVLTNTGNSWNGPTSITGGALRATDGSTIPGTNLVLNGGALETGANVARPLGTNAGEVQLPGGASGFSAFGAPITVNLGGAAAPLQWGGATFNPSALVLNQPSANNTLDFQNPIDLNGATRTVNANANTATLSGVLSTGTGTAGLTKTGAGTLVLSAANAYNGTTTISGGILGVSADNNLGASNTPITFNGGVLRISGTAMNTLGGHVPTYTSNASAGYDVADAANTITLPGAFALGSGGTPVFTKAGAGRLILTGANTTGRLFVQGGTLEIPAGASLTVSNTGGDGIKGSVANGTIDGPGTIFLSAANTTTTTDFADNSTATGLTLTINAQLSSLPATPNAGFEVCCDDPGGTIVLTNPANDFAGMVILNRPSTISLPAIGMAGVASPAGKGSIIQLSPNAGSARLLYTGAGETTNRVLQLGNNGTVEHAGTGTLKFTADVVANGANVKTLTLQGSTAGVGEIAGVIPNNSTTNLTSVVKSGTGTWVLSGNNTYGGLTTVNSGGVLRISNNNALGATGTAAGVLTNIVGDVGGTGRLELAGNITTGETIQIAARQGASLDVPALSNFSGSNTITAQVVGVTGGTDYNIESQAGLLTLAGGYANTAGTGTRNLKLMGAGNGLVSGAIQNGTAGPLTLTKVGGGTWTLTGNNTLTGQVSVNGGTLLANNATGGQSSTGTGPVVVGGTGVFGGTGNVAGTVTVNAGGTLAPGASPGTLTLGNTLTFNNNATLAYEIGATPAGSDLVAVTGDLAYAAGATWNLNISNFAAADTTGQTYTMITYTGADPAALPTVAFTGPLGGTVTFDTANNQVLLSNISPVPEPAALGLLGLAGAALMGRRRRAR